MSGDSTENLPAVSLRESRSRRHGLRAYADPWDLWDDACSYFEWVQNNPLKQQKVFCNSAGAVTYVEVDKPRIMSIHALCLFLGVSRESFDKWSNGDQFPDHIQVCQRIRDTIYAQKFEGAAADLFNASVVVRDLGLVDKSELSGAGQGPISINTSSMSTAALLELRKAMGSDETEQG